MSTILEKALEVYHVDLKKARQCISSWKLLFPALFALSLPVQATVYYVDIGSGSDSNSGTSSSSPWAHLPGRVGVSASGWAVIKSGDVVYVKGGTVNPVSVFFNPTWYGGSASFDSILVQSG